MTPFTFPATPPLRLTPSEQAEIMKLVRAVTRASNQAAVARAKYQKPDIHAVTKATKELKKYLSGLR